MNPDRYELVSNDAERDELCMDLRQYRTLWSATWACLVYNFLESRWGDPGTVFHVRKRQDLST